MKRELIIDLQIPTSVTKIETIPAGTILTVSYAVPCRNTVTLIVDEDRSFSASIEMIEFCSKEIS